MHTPGPWTVNRQANAIQGFDNRFVIDLNGARLADAHLIAAAPALLEALEHCIDRLEAWVDGEKHAQVAAETRGDRHAAEGHYYTVTNYKRLVDRARAAIVRATQGADDSA